MGARIHPGEGEIVGAMTHLTALYKSVYYYYYDYPIVKYMETTRSPTIRYEMLFNVCSKAGISQLNLQHGINNLKWKTETLKSKKTDMLRSIGKQFGGSIHSVVKKKRKAAMGRICRKGRF